MYLFDVKHFEGQTLPVEQARRASAATPQGFHLLLWCNIPRPGNTCGTYWPLEIFFGSAILIDFDTFLHTLDLSGYESFSLSLSPQDVVCFLTCPSRSRLVCIFISCSDLSADYIYLSPFVPLSFRTTLFVCSSVCLCLTLLSQHHSFTVCLFV